MERDFFGDLPSEITTNILSRLPIRSLVISKSICKPWLNLIDSDDFHKSEIKTPPALVLLTGKMMDSTWCAIFEIEDEDVEKSHEFHHIPLMDLEIPHGNIAIMEGITANGLLLLYALLSPKGIPVYICNLITREYTELCFPEDYIPGHSLKFGFGVSKISGQYKVVCINAITGSHYVYTLGTGTWRRVEAGAASGFRFSGPSIECNGNINWRVFDLCGDMSICGFDVETECFRIFSIPPVGDGYRDWYLSILRDCLCYFYSSESEIVIWMMKEYQVEDSWAIEYKLDTIGFDFELDCVCVHPIKHFKDGDIFMLLVEYDLIYYSNKTRTFHQVGVFKDGSAGFLTALIFTPSLFSLKNFGFENVISF